MHGRDFGRFGKKSNEKAYIEKQNNTQHLQGLLRTYLFPCSGAGIPQGHVRVEGPDIVRGGRV
jgi:hypothetical protein